MMKTTDETMLVLLDQLKSYKVIKYDNEFCDAIGISKTNLWNIRNEIAHFTVEHIRMACKIYDVNANYIFGLDHKIFNHNRYVDKTPIKSRVKEDI